MTGPSREKERWGDWTLTIYLFDESKRKQNKNKRGAEASKNHISNMSANAVQKFCTNMKASKENPRTLKVRKYLRFV